MLGNRFCRASGPTSADNSKHELLLKQSALEMAGLRMDSLLDRAAGDRRIREP